MQSDNQLIRKIKRKKNKEAADVLISSNVLCKYYYHVMQFVLKPCNEQI